MPRKDITQQYKEQSLERLYKLYSIKDRSDYEGSTIKYECTINGERGIFKERRSMQSKDHVMEQVAYELANVLGVSCCFNRCRKAQGVYGSFSRFEIRDLSKVIPYANILNKDEGLVDIVLNNTIKLTRNNINSFVKQLYQFIIFDFIMGQQDRHLENLAVERTSDRKIKWYPLYDNGFCLSACSSHDTAITELGRGFYSSRMGDSSYIEENILAFRKLIFPDDLRKLIRYQNMNIALLLQIIDKSDKYNQIPQSRRQAIANFMMLQAKIINHINIHNELLEV